MTYATNMNTSHFFDFLELFRTVCISDYISSCEIFPNFSILPRGPRKNYKSKMFVGDLL